MTDQSEPPKPTASLPRSVKLVGLAAAFAGLSCLAMVLVEVLTLWRYWPPKRIDVALVVGGVAVLELARRASGWSWVEPAVRGRLGRWTGRADGLAEHALAGRRPTIAVAGLIVIVLASWAPHYLTWPLWTDHDVLGTLAIGWDRGKLPWRDQFSFQFPGEIELFWVLGKTVGWGSSVSFYAADLALLAALLTTVAVTCRESLGRWLPGLTACLSILGYYVTLAFTHVAQRDWHAAELAAVSLMLLTTGGSPRRWIASALVFATAMTFRPHAFVFLPAIGLALALPPQGPSAGWKRMLIWIGVVTAGMLATFSPVILGGLTGDFLRAMRTAGRSGGFYAEASLARSWELLLYELRDGWTWFQGAALAALAWWGASQASRRFAAILFTANVCVLFYRPLHPVDHAYLTQPLALFQALAVAVLADAVVSATASRVTGLVRLAVLVVLVALAFPWGEPNCNPKASLTAIQALATRSDLAESPPGSARAYPSRGGQAGFMYSWSDYLATLDYLRENTDPSTPVANLLTYFPYPSMNAAVGRATPLPMETISLINWFPDVDFDSRTAPALEASPDAVVIRDAEHIEGGLGRRLIRTLETLNRCYVPVARFGGIEILRRDERGGESRPPAASSVAEESRPGALLVPSDQPNDHPGR